MSHFFFRSNFVHRLAWTHWLWLWRSLQTLLIRWQQMVEANWLRLKSFGCLLKPLAKMETHAQSPSSLPLFLSHNHNYCVLVIYESSFNIFLLLLLLLVHTLIKQVFSHLNLNFLVHFRSTIFVHFVTYTLFLFIVHRLLFLNRLSKTKQ